MQQALPSVAPEPKAVDATLVTEPKVEEQSTSAPEDQLQSESAITIARASSTSIDNNVKPSVDNAVEPDESVITQDEGTKQAEPVDLPPSLQQSADVVGGDDVPPVQVRTSTMYGSGSTDNTPMPTLPPSSAVVS